MKTLCGLLLCSIALALCPLPSVSADNLPLEIADALQQREQNLSRLTFNWSLLYQESDSPKLSQNVPHMQDAIKRQLPEKLRKDGITDRDKIDQIVTSQTLQIAQELRNLSFSYASAWEFARDGETTLVNGNVGKHVVNEYQQFYDRHSGMLIDVAAHDENGSAVSTMNPIVWANSGDATRYRSPLQEGLNLTPEDFVMLTGFSPLSMYGVQWRLVSTTQDDWVVQSRVTQGNFAPFDAKLWLSRKYEGAPIKIVLTGDKWTSEYNALKFERFGHVWICDKVEALYALTGLISKQRNWSLQGVKQSAPIVLTLHKNVAVEDERLLGPDLTTRSVLEAQTRHNHRIVSYNWTGVFPSTEQLENIYKRRHPGEGSPDPGTAASTMQFLGGLMALTGAVWMFKRRGSSV